MPVSAFANQSITLASTTSTQNSGLYEHILPVFSQDTGIAVRVIAVGTGQALRLAENGDADVVIVHHRASEDAFIEAGFGTQRFDIMYNDFVLIGPFDDPAAVEFTPNIFSAFAVIGETESVFISRGDASGTHKKEQEIWENSGFSAFDDWYREIGAGMGAALNMAVTADAYTLSDRGTWLSFGNKVDHKLLFEDKKNLRNPYSLILVSQERHSHINKEAAESFAKWLISEKGQAAIASFEVDGIQLFCPILQDLDHSDATCPSK